MIHKKDLVWKYDLRLPLWKTSLANGDPNSDYEGEPKPTATRQENKQLERRKAIKGAD